VNGEAAERERDGQQAKKARRALREEREDGDGVELAVTIVSGFHVGEWSSVMESSTHSNGTIRHGRARHGDIHTADEWHTLASRLSQYKREVHHDGRI
jgi:hypothetical protein